MKYTLNQGYRMVSSTWIFFRSPLKTFMVSFEMITSTMLSRNVHDWNFVSPRAAICHSFNVGKRNKTFLNFFFFVFSLYRSVSHLQYSTALSCVMFTTG